MIVTIPRLSNSYMKKTNNNLDRRELLAEEFIQLIKGKI